MLFAIFTAMQVNPSSCIVYFQCLGWVNPLNGLSFQKTLSLSFVKIMFCSSGCRHRLDARGNTVLFVSETKIVS